MGPVAAPHPKHLCGLQTCERHFGDNQAPRLRNIASRLSSRSTSSVRDDVMSLHTVEGQKQLMPEGLDRHFAPSSPAGIIETTDSETGYHAAHALQRTAFPPRIISARPSRHVGQRSHLRET